MRRVAPSFSNFPFPAGLLFVSTLIGIAWVLITWWGNGSTVLLPVLSLVAQVAQCLWRMTCLTPDLWWSSQLQSVTKFYCLVTEALERYQLAQCRTRQRIGWDSNPRPLDHESIAVTIALTSHTSLLIPLHRLFCATHIGKTLIDRRWCRCSVQNQQLLTAETLHMSSVAAAENDDDDDDDDDLKNEVTGTILFQ